MRGIASALAALAVSGCAMLPDGGTPMSESLSHVARTTAIGLIKTVNAMGVDPWQASPAALARWEEACFNLSAVVTVWDLTLPSASVDVENTCATILEAAAAAPPAVPDGMPGGDSQLAPPAPGGAG